MSTPTIQTATTPSTLDAVPKFLDIRDFFIAARPGDRFMTEGWQSARTYIFRRRLDHGRLSALLGSDSDYQLVGGAVEIISTSYREQPYISGIGQPAYLSETLRQNRVFVPERVSAWVTNRMVSGEPAGFGHHLVHHHVDSSKYSREVLRGLHRDAVAARDSRAVDII